MYTCVYYISYVHILYGGAPATERLHRRGHARDPGLGGVICIYIYICYTYYYIYIYIYVCMYVCMCVCVYIYIYIYTSTS